MSSLRLSDSPQESPKPRTQWITVRAPQDEPAQAKPTGVVLSLQARRRGLRAGERREEVVELVNDFGGGDADVADDVANDLDARWDN